MNQKRPYKKATREEIEQRVLTVFRLWVQEATGPEISEYCEKQWGIQTTESYEYLKRAKTLARDRGLVDAAAELGRELEKRGTLYKMALADRNLFAALGAADSKCKLLGLFAPQKYQEVPAENPYQHLTKEEARLALDTLDQIKGARTVSAPKESEQREPARRPRRKAKATGA